MIGVVIVIGIWLAMAALGACLAVVAIADEVPRLGVPALGVLIAIGLVALWKRRNAMFGQARNAEWIH